MVDPYAERLRARTEEVRRRRAELVAAIESIRASRRLTVADDEHDPEGSTASLDQTRQEALLAQTERTLEELDHAGRRLAAGEHGRCEGCGGDIPAGRLQVRPDARLCVPCASRAGGPPRRR